jgi:hypothetical protein
MGIKPGPNGKRLVLLLWLLVTIFYFYLSYDYIRATMNDREFREYVAYLVQVAGTERRPPKEIRQLILLKADQLMLPIREDQVSVKGIGTTLDVTVDYQVDVEVPLFERVVYTKAFHHDAKYHQQ